MIQIIPFQHSEQPGYLPLLVRGLADLTVLRFNTAQFDAEINTGLDIRILHEQMTNQDIAQAWDGQDVWFSGEIKSNHGLIEVVMIIFDPAKESIVYRKKYITSEKKFLADWEDQLQRMVNFLSNGTARPEAKQIMITQSLDAFLEFRTGLEILSQSSKNGLWEEGIEHLLMAVAYDPQFFEAADILLLFMIQNNVNQDLDYCIHVLERLKNYAEPHPRIPLVMAEIFLRWGNTEKAEALLKEVTSQFPEFVEGWLRLALFYQSQGNYLEAINALQTLLGRDPDNATALDLMGAIYAGLEDHGKAESVWLRTLEIDPERVNVLNNLGLLAEEKNNPDLAEAYFQKAIQLNNQWWGSFYNFGSFCKRRGRVEEAAALLTQANTLNASHYPTALLLAEVSIRLGRFAEAQEALIQTLQIAPDNVIRRQALEMLEQLNTDAVQTELQIRSLEKYWEDGKRAHFIILLIKNYFKGRKCWYYWYLWGLAFEKAYPRFFMAELLKKGLRLNPGYAYALLKKLGLYYWKTGDSTKALPLLRAAFNLDHSDPETVRAYLQTLITTGALEEYQSYVKYTSQTGISLP